MALPSKEQRSSPNPKGPAKPSSPQSYTRYQFREKLKGTWKDAKLPTQKRIGLEKELFPWQKFGDTLNESKVKTRLRELRKKETYTQDWKEKKKLEDQRKTLEKGFDLKGKY